MTTDAPVIKEIDIPHRPVKVSEPEHPVEQPVEHPIKSHF